MLYNKYRPKKFKEFVGNEETIGALHDLIVSKNFPHSVIFYGDSGCGKTTAVRILAKYLGADKNWDYREINSADLRGIDTVRELIQQASLSSMVGGNKIFVLDEAHQMTKDAQNALLKVLEDTPEHVYFFLVTTEPEKLIPTIKTRCTMFEFRKLGYDEAMELLNRVTEAEGIEIDGTTKDLIFDLSLGRPREMLSILEKVAHSKNPAKILGEVGKESGVIELCRLLMKGNVPWKTIAKAIKGINDNLDFVRNVMMSYFSTVLLSEDNARAYFILDALKNRFYHKGHLVAMCYEVYSMEVDDAE